MKLSAVLLILTIALPGYARSWDTLQKAAEEKFLNQTEVDTKVGHTPKKIVRIEFETPVTQVVLNRIDSPLFKPLRAYTEYVFSLTRDVDFVEIFLYAGDDELNCYATFEEGILRDLTKCEKTKRKGESHE